MCQDHMGDRFVGDASDALNHLVGEARGGLRLDDHHSVIADDRA